MKKLIKKLLNLFSIKVSILNKKNELLALGLHKGNANMSNDLTSIKLKDFGFSVNYHTHRYIIEGLRIIYALRDKLNAKFSFDNDVLIVNIGSLVYEVQTYEEFFILNEIFINGSYNFFLPKNYHLIDIGLNVAYTSLYLAAQTNCLSVHAFEPFEPTYNQAQVNINLNAALKAKIKTYNYGLGANNETIKVAYDKAFKGNMGINGIPGFLSNQQHKQVEEDIVIKKASEILLPIIDNLAGHGNDIVLKVDCEGSEYDIFRSFSETSILKQLNVIILEWHVKGPEEICAYLKEVGFTYFSLPGEGNGVGMIYAYKQ